MNKNTYEMSEEEKKMIETIVNAGNRVTIIPIKDGKARYFQENRIEIKVGETNGNQTGKRTKNG